MALTTAALILKISSALGQADKDLQATKVDTVVSSTVFTSNKAAGNLKLARNTALTDAASSDATDLDNYNTLLTAFRTVEKKYVTTVDPILKDYLTALDTYFTAQNGRKLRPSFTDATVAWTDDFRALWRRIQNEEIIVRLGTVTKASGTWGAFTADKTIALPSSIELRLPVFTATAAITVNVTLSKLGGGTDIVEQVIPTTATTGTVYPLRLTAGNGKYTGISSVSVTGGADTDSLAFWVGI